jgi:hypothetical protein
VGDKQVNGALRDTITIPNCGVMRVKFIASNPGRHKIVVHSDLHYQGKVFALLKYEAS